MTKYHEILRLTALGLSQRNVVQNIGVSQKTVIKVQKTSTGNEMHLSWLLDETLTDAALKTLMFPKKSKVFKQKRMPNFNYIQKELLRNGVNKKLLWTEYLEKCRQSGDEPLMYSQFCYYIQQDEQKRAQPCISIGSPASRSKLTGQEILRRSPIRIPAGSSPHT